MLLDTERTTKTNEYLHERYIEMEYTTNEIILFLVKASFFLSLLLLFFFLLFFVLAHSILTCTNNGEKMKSLTINFEYGVVMRAALGVLFVILFFPLRVHPITALTSISIFLIAVNILDSHACHFQFLSSNKTATTKK